MWRRVISFILALLALLPLEARKVVQSMNFMSDTLRTARFHLPDGNILQNVVTLHMPPVKPPKNHGIGKNGVSLAFVDSVSGLGRVFNLRAANDRTSGFEGEDYYHVSVTDISGDSVIDCAEIRDTKSRHLFRGNNEIKLYIVSGRRMQVEVNREPAVAMLDGMTVSRDIKLSLAGKVRLNSIELESVVNDHIEMPVEQLDSMVAAASETSHICGYYTFLDRENNPDYAEPGGYYTLAVVPDGFEGRYRIIYVDGAKVASDLWLRGMTKGYLTSTRFSDHFNLQWIDSNGETMNEEVFASINGSILELNFPLYETVMRFQRRVK